MLTLIVVVIKESISRQQFDAALSVTTWDDSQHTLGYPDYSKHENFIVEKGCNAIICHKPGKF